MEPRGAASRHWAEQACRSAGFEPDVRFETADLQAQIRLIESGNAVALMPDLVWTGRGTTARLLELPGNPHRTVFTSVRRSSAQRPGHPGSPGDPGCHGRSSGGGRRRVTAAVGRVHRSRVPVARAAVFRASLRGGPPALDWAVMNRTMFKSKIHRATVTHADLHYVGSVTVDLDLLEAADILPGELVAIVDVTNGARLETYTIAGERGSGVIGINGAAAHLMHENDIVILITYAQMTTEEAKAYDAEGGPRGQGQQDCPDRATIPPRATPRA